MHKTTLRFDSAWPPDPSALTTRGIELLPVAVVHRARATAGLDVLAELKPATVSRLLETLEDVPADELARAAAALSRMSPGLVRRVIRRVADPRVAGRRAVASL